MELELILVKSKFEKFISNHSRNGCSSNSNNDGGTSSYLLCLSNISSTCPHIMCFSISTAHCMQVIEFEFFDS